MLIYQFVARKASFFLVLVSVLAAILSSDLRAAEPSNPNATQDTRALLNWLASLKDRTTNHLMFGQWAGWRNEPVTRVEEIYTLTGKYPAMIGAAAVRTSSNQIKTQPRLDSDYIIAYAKKGGIISLDQMLLNPWTGGGGHDTTGASPSSAQELFISGTTANTNLMKELSSIADVLQIYENAGVVVIWRPWMEMNMEWNWVNKIGPSAFKQLWVMAYNYLTTTRGLDNILWLYAPSGLRQGAIDWYPGDNYVDILAPTLYADFIDDPDRTVTRWFKDEFYPWAVNKGKPIGLSEYGRSINPPFDQVEGYLDIVKEVKSKFPAVVFIRAWNDRDRYLGFTGTPSSNVKGVFADPYVMTLDEVDWKSGNTLTPPLTPTGLTITVQ